jgi:hypothetical protein
MKRNLFPMLALALSLLAGAAFAWAQAPSEAGLPLRPPPPDGQFLYLGMRHLSGELKPVTGAPFSAQATTETTQVLADGNSINRTERSKLYRDSAGRTRRDAELSSIGPWSATKAPHSMVEISDPVAGARYVLDVQNKTATTMPRVEFGLNKRDERKDTAARKQEAGGSLFQRTTESLGTEQMAGVTVEGTRTTETIPAGAVGNDKPLVVVSERWYSPELQTTVYSKHTDPRFGTTVYQLTNISREEPEASLFQVPADYTVKAGQRMRHSAQLATP